MEEKQSPNKNKQKTPLNNKKINQDHSQNKEFLKVLTK